MVARGSNAFVVAVPGTGVGAQPRMYVHTGVGPGGYPALKLKNIHGFIIVKLLYVPLLTDVREELLEAANR